MSGSNLGSAFVTITSDASRFKAGLDTSKQLFDGFTSHITSAVVGLGGILAAGFTVTKIVEAFSKAEVASNQMKAALTAVGQNTEANIARLERFNAMLSKNTTIGKSAAAEMERYALTLGVPVDKLEAITTAGVGLNRVLGLQDPVRATQLAVMAAEGYTQRLQRMIPALRGVKNEEQARAVVNDMVRKGLILEGEYMETLEGRWVMFQKSLHGEAVAIGAIFAPAMKLGVVILTDLADHVTDIIKKLGAANYDIPNITRLFGNLFNAISTSGPIWNQLSDAIVGIAQTFAKGFDNMVGEVDRLVSALDRLLDKTDAVGKFFETQNLNTVLTVTGGLAEKLFGKGKLTLTDGWVPDEEPSIGPKGGGARPLPMGGGLMGVINNAIKFFGGKAAVMPFGGLPKLPGKPDTGDMYGFGKVFHALGGENGPATTGDIRKLGDRLLARKDGKLVEVDKTGKVIGPATKRPKPKKAKPPKAKKAAKGPKQPLTSKVYSDLDRSIRDNADIMKWMSAVGVAAVRGGRASPGSPDTFRKAEHLGEKGLTYWQRIAKSTESTENILKHQKNGLR